MPAGQLDVEVRPAGAVDGWVVANPGGVFLSNGHSYSLLAVGSLSDDTFRLVTAIDGIAPPPAPATVRVLHASPDAPAVDVYADGASVLTGVAFGTISEYMEVPGDPPAPGLRRGQRSGCRWCGHRRHRHLRGGHGLHRRRHQQPGHHRGPGHRRRPVPGRRQGPDPCRPPVGRRPAVAIAADGTKKPLIKKLTYPNASKYLTVPAGDYDLEVRVASAPKTVALDLDPITLDAGTSYSAFAIGSATGGTLTVVPAVDATPVAPLILR